MVLSTKIVECSSCDKPVLLRGAIDRCAFTPKENEPYNSHPSWAFRGDLLRLPRLVSDARLASPVELEYSQMALCVKSTETL